MRSPGEGELIWRKGGGGRSISDRLNVGFEIIAVEATDEKKL